MTDVAVTRFKELSPKQLQQTRSTCETIETTAWKCRSNFEWIATNDRNHIPFFDTDVLQTLMPSKVVMDAIFKSERRVPKALGVLQTETLLGSHVIRYYLEPSMKYCLPEGTLREATDWIAALEERTKHHAKEAVSTLSDMASLSQKASGAGSRTIDFSRKNITQLKNNLLTVVANTEDVTLLEMLLENSHPIDELTGSKPLPETEQVFREMYRHLNRVRPEPNKQYANYCDAMNAASIVQVFNYAQTTPRKATFPVLISTTKPILQNSRILDKRLTLDTNSYLGCSYASEYSNVFSDRPSVVSDQYYFAVSRAILSHVYDRFSLAASYADSLARDARSVGEICTQLLFMMGSGSSRRRHSSETSVDLQLLYEQLMIKSERFSRNWVPFLLKPEKLATADRVSWINRLLGASITHRLLSSSQDTARVAALELISGLKARQHQQSDFWDLLLRYDKLDDQIPAAEIRSIRRFSFSVVDDDGTPLSEITEGTPVESVFEMHFESVDSLRLVCHSPNNFGGAVLAVDYFFCGDDGMIPYFRIVWTHAKSLDACWERANSILQALHLEETTGSVRLMRPHAIASKEISFTRPVVPLNELLELFFYTSTPFNSRASNSSADVMDRIRRGEGNLLPRFFDLTVGDFTVFADLDLMEESEMQFGIIFPCNCWSQMFSSCVTAFSRTNDRFIRGELATALFHSVAKIFGVTTGE